MKYLDKDSRSAGEGSRNLVVFDDSNIRIRARNGQPIDTTRASPEAPPTGRKEAEARIARPEDQKALADQYRVNPETGDFPELADIEQLKLAGRLTEADIAELDAAKADMETAEAYGEALKSVTGCLL
jgi:hypothetical protein